MKVSWLPIELCPITCLYVTKHRLFTQNSNLISRSINIKRSLHVKRSTLNIIIWLPGRAIKSPPPHGAIKAVFGLDLITCTPRDKIHVVCHTGEPLHYSRISSFKIPTIPSPITTSLHNKTSLASYFHIKTLIKTKFIRWTQPLIFVWLQRSWDHYRVVPIFLRELNFANGDFFLYVLWD